MALINAGLTTLYIVGVGCFMYYGNSIKIGKTNAFLAPIVLLLLLVMSASITGFLIFGKPALMYIDGKKKEALSLLAQTLTFFSIITFLAIILLVTFTR
ncbi:MAG: hypothetical protein COX79_01740 [Candidatus Levybacteria bacterium CG_4_10_14_0_2_um_filter_36_16]|nr:MAG: hypothetical protein AUK12_00300 [Candidatus Levybacteria bacterium CG2_30_37_29]PIR79569.1 MAG: hypothetical protein COU26_00445 [Candidatus Levybacteria bacterium CG10_big_fil_rev_8_21_14_0_10_36_30]PIZ97555.1 MAG: hypothetical protein COX79_01740 [Candidatus Levybacteria bacterium CG_4_10_14_0_2_um_filter_36_16]PJA90092.1 MAG: hypothetical protein CO136_03135 [Candidatus Levybacteria bacterium CG_4_9_14_3_um_filter_36_7]